MSTVYRSAASDQKQLRPLEPEDEMRLLLARADGPRSWVGRLLLARYPILLVLHLVVGFCVRTTWLLLVPHFAAGTFILFAQWRRHRRYLRELRERGYDVSRFSH